MAVITSVGTAVPACTIRQHDAETFLRENYADRVGPRAMSVAHDVLAHPSIQRRHISIAEWSERAQIVDEDPDERVERFTRWAVRLSGEAARDALQRSALRPEDVSAVVVNTCTGYICPGLSTYLINELGLPAVVRAHDLVGAGCAGAIPNLQITRDIVANDRAKAALSVSVEICSATFQMSDDLGLVVSNAIFGDGAAAAVVRAEGAGLEVLDSMGFIEPKYRDDVRYEYRQGRLHNRLSRRVPVIVGNAVKDILDRFLQKHGLRVGQIRHWAIHPAGYNVIECIRDKAGLSDEQLAITRSILADYGNMSSPSVWFELQKILAADPADGEWCIMLSFGAGFSIYVQLLRRKRPASSFVRKAPHTFTAVPLPGYDASSTAGRVGRFWDDISDAWRLTWGPHIHHGYYESGSETALEAQEKLVAKLADWAGLAAGETILDAGCGMGASAVWLAKTLAASVTGITLSRRQVELAVDSARLSGVANANFRVDDALSMATLLPKTFDVVWSLESCEQFFDKRLFLRQAGRVLKPGGKLVLATWCSSADAYTGPAARVYEKLCRAFDLPCMPSMAFYESALTWEGFRVMKLADWSQYTAQSWPRGIRIVKGLSWAALFSRGGLPAFKFAHQLKRMAAAYSSGMVRYGVFLATLARPRIVPAVPGRIPPAGILGINALS